MNVTMSLAAALVSFLTTNVFAPVSVHDCPGSYACDEQSVPYFVSVPVISVDTRNPGCVCQPEDAPGGKFTVWVTTSGECSTPIGTMPNAAETAGCRLSQSPRLVTPSARRASRNSGSWSML